LTGKKREIISSSFALLPNTPSWLANANIDLGKRCMDAQEPMHGFAQKEGEKNFCLKQIQNQTVHF